MVYLSFQNPSVNYWYTDVFRTRTFQIWPFNTFGYTMLRCFFFTAKSKEWHERQQAPPWVQHSALSEKWILVFKESNPKSAHSFLSILKGMCKSLCTYEGIMVKDFVWRQYLREINWVFFLSIQYAWHDVGGLLGKQTAFNLRHRMATDGVVKAWRLV